VKITTKLTGEYRTADFRPAGMPSVKCPKWWGEWKCVSHCLACPKMEALQVKIDGFAVTVWCNWEEK